MNTRKLSHRDESEFLGILTGKRKKAKAAADISVIQAQTDAYKQKLMMDMQANNAGYTPEKDKAEATQQLEETKQTGEKTLYVIIGVVVVAVMFVVFLIKKH